MDQKKIGGFIALLRKEKGMTQQNLAEELNISDKTISKWENGKSMPDIIYLGDLSRLLEANISEILAGERFDDTDYTVKTEETICSLMEDHEKKEKNHFLKIIIGFAILILAVSGMFLAIPSSIPKDSSYPQCFFDLPGIGMLLSLTIAGILISGKRGLKDVLIFAGRIILYIGIAVSLIGLIVVLSQETAVKELSVQVGVSILPILYAVVIKTIVLIVLEMKK